ncbi:LNP protein, partial [Polypterus senegalus]
MLQSTRLLAPGVLLPGCVDLRQRNISQRNPTASTPVPANPSHGVALSVVPGTPSGQMTTSAPGGPPERHPASIAQQNLMRQAMTPGTPMPGMGRHPPGPPLARPILPRERGAMDRVIEFLVGDGPQNRYALICQQCFSHNGMALKEEYEYIEETVTKTEETQPESDQEPEIPVLPCEEQQVEETLRLEDGQPSENEKEKDDDVSLMETE